MYSRNKLGGLDPTEKHLLERAKKADLVTLPKDVQGTNCFNCKYIENKDRDVGFCRHPKVQEKVTHRMCCALWDNSGIHRAFGKIDVKYT